MTSVVVEHNPSPLKLEVLGVEAWPQWEKDVSTFEWQYDHAETCYLEAGAAVLRCVDGETVPVREGDLVTIFAGVRCVWDIRARLRKRYKIGEGLPFG